MKTFRNTSNIAKYFYAISIAACFSLSCNNKKEYINTKLVTKKMPDGSVKVVGAVINGKKEGLWIEYDDSGKLSSQETYVNDSLSGEFIGYHDDGKTILSKGVLENGKEEGEWIIYYDKDKVAQKGQYKNGNKTGVWEYYIEEGQLNKKIEYSDKGKEIILDNHLLPPTPDQMPPEPVDSNNRAYVK